MRPDSLVDQHIHRLDRALSGPSAVKRRMLTEARDGLDDAVRDLCDAGEPRVVAQRRAVAEFGSVDEVAPAFQAELAASAARVFGLRVVAVFGVSAFCSDLMWQGAPWTGPQPPAGYLLLSESVDWLGRVAIAGALLGSLALWLATRRGRAVSPRLLRGAMVALVVVLGLIAASGTALYGWSAGMWSGALTWPPMLVGGAAMTIATAWIGRAAVTGLGAVTRTPRRGNGPQWS
ncbi:permease prefix domain 1-containing protein [Asanoa sp. WMMD1127]|uniref:permease prefix domain 1-containing protein n=1 Tax=Asanoa sp. WMMD1127 TaxID=3016107 RepID=UPI0024176EAD|nr:permease prefix domain 1-containing protein [Asanoa sp. WMMD1127]MDG4822786.1 permease prefix domain 1-containing protein [Asanoa sp. WMMD1127]